MESKKYTTGDRFMLLRKVKGFKQEEMADILKIDPKTLSKIENNEVQPKIDLIERFVGVLNISIEDFFRFSENNIFHNNIHESSQFELNNTKLVSSDEIYLKLLEEKEKRIQEKDKLLEEKNKLIESLYLELKQNKI